MPKTMRKIIMTKVENNISIKSVSPHIRDDHARQLRSEFVRELFVNLFEKAWNKSNNVDLELRQPSGFAVNR
jgi:hypothetical protein